MAELRIWKPEGLAAQLRKFNGEEKELNNYMPFVQIVMHNREVIEADETGECFASLLKFIYEAGGPKRINNVIMLIQQTGPTMPEVARKAQQSVVDEYFKEYWAWFDALK